MAVDCHIHMALDGGYWKDALARHKEAPDEAFIRKTLEQFEFERGGEHTFTAALPNAILQTVDRRRELF